MKKEAFGRAAPPPSMNVINKSMPMPENPYSMAQPMVTRAVAAPHQQQGRPHETSEIWPVVSGTASLSISPQQQESRKSARVVAPPPPHKTSAQDDPPGLLVNDGSMRQARPGGPVMRANAAPSHGFGRRPPPTQPAMKAPTAIGSRTQLRPVASPTTAQDSQQASKRPILSSLRQATRTEARPPTPTRNSQSPVGPSYESRTMSPMTGYKNPPPSKSTGPRPNLSQLKRQWMEQQRKLKSKMIIPENEKDSLNLGDVGLIAGIDIGHWRENKKTAKELCVALVVYSYPKFQEVYRDAMVFPVTAPYVSGFLAFREVEPLVRLFDKLRQTTPIFLPDVTLVHANGTLHFRGFGLACHFGVLADVPCIGVASSPLVFDGLTFENVRRDAQNLKPGDHHNLVGRSGKTHGAALGVHNGSSIYVSIGNKISLRAAVEVVNACCDTSRGKLTRPIPLISAGRITRLNPTALARWLEDRDSQKNGGRGAGKASRPTGQKLVNRGTPLITVARTTKLSTPSGPSSENVWKRRRANLSRQ